MGPDLLHAHVLVCCCLCSGTCQHMGFQACIVFNWLSRAEMSNQQLMTKGKRLIDDTENTLARTERIVEDTQQVGTQVRL